MPCRWFVYKHAVPLPVELVRFQPYQDSDDFARGTTVLPYLEAFYQYGSSPTCEETVADHRRGSAPSAEPPQDVSHLQVVQGNWVSESDMFGQHGAVAASLQSVNSADRSTENIVQLKSRVSSQDNG